MWLKELKTHANPDIKVFLIGNKIDLIDNRKVSAEEAKNLRKIICLIYIWKLQLKQDLMLRKFS